MKSLFKQNPSLNREDIDALIENEAKPIYSTAYDKGRHWGLQEMPSMDEENFAPFLMDIKAKCEQLALKVLQKLKPALHLPQGRLDADWADMHHKRLGGEIKEMDKHIALNRHEIGSYNPAEMQSRIRKANLIAFGVFVAEVVQNSQAFQLYGDNQLYCILLASSISLAVGFGAHFAGRQYKDAKTKFKRRVVVIVSFISMLILSSVVASMRSMFLKKIGVDIDPLNFTIFNMVFFLIAALASWYFFPTKAELDRNRENLHKHNAMLDLEKKKKAKVKEQVEHEKSSKEIVHGHLDATMEAEYAIERIKSVYAEAVAIFINANMLCRKEIPPCLNSAPPPLNIPHITFYATINKYKNTNHENNTDYYPA
jgi:hypothetical protein